MAQGNEPRSFDALDGGGRHVAAGAAPAVGPQELRWGATHAYTLGCTHGKGAGAAGTCGVIGS